MTPRPKRRSFAARLPRQTGFLILLLAAVILIVLVYRFDFTQDDAYITFRYAANYVSGHGLVYNVGERVEGYTNFLWTIFMILGRLAGLDLVFFSKLLGTLFGLGTLVFAFSIARQLFGDASPPWRSILSGLCALLVGSAWSFAYWTVAGLETAAFACAVTAAIYYYLTRSYLVIPALIAATLFRPEGGLVFVILTGFETIAGQKLSRYAVVTAILYALFLTPLAIFKLLYYGDLLPNPFYAKTSFTAEQVWNGLAYTGQYFWHYLGAGLFLAPALLVWRRWDRSLRLMAFFVLVYTLYIILIGGDVLKVHRFFVPIMPVMALIALYGLWILRRSGLVVVVCTIIILAWQTVFPYKHAQTFHFREVGLIRKMNQLMNHLTAADSKDFSLAASTIGLVGYRLLGHQVIDMLGLTDSTIARHPEPIISGLTSSWRESQYNSPYILTRQPDYILFSTGFKPSAPAERSLFLYTSFHRAYRTIGFFFSGNVHSIFKRYFPVDGPLERDVNPLFANCINRAINLFNDTKDFRSALSAVDSAIQFAPYPEYPYSYYYRFLIQAKAGDNTGAMESIRKAVQNDTLISEAYLNLAQIENMYGNDDAVRFYRERTLRLTPWYQHRLDSILAKSRGTFRR